MGFSSHRESHSPKWTLLLWESVPAEAEAPFSEEGAREIERRVAELDAGTAQTVPWSQIRDEALARIGHGPSN